MSKLILIIFALLAITLPVLGQELSPQDYSRLTKQKTIENVLFERYLNSEKGPISVMGYHFDSFINEFVFSSLAIFGAIGGDRGGYGIASIGLGFNYPINKQLSCVGKLLVGSGGGGGVPAGGGLAIEPQIGLAYEIIDNIGIQIMTGQLYFPSGEFSSPIYNIGLTYTFYQIKIPY